MTDINKKLVDAAANGDLKAIKALVSQGADLEYADRHGNTPMSNAVWNGDIPVLDFLYLSGAEIHPSGINLLNHAVFNVQVEALQWLLDHGHDPNHCDQKTGENGLHSVITKTSHMDKRTEIVKMLVDAGTDVNKKTVKGAETACFMRDAFLKGETPLHRAAAYGDEKIIRILLGAGADPSVKDGNGDTPISWGSWYLRPSEVLGLLLYGEVPGWYGFPNPNLGGKDLI